MAAELSPQQDKQPNISLVERFRNIRVTLGRVTTAALLIVSGSFATVTIEEGVHPVAAYADTLGYPDVDMPCEHSPYNVSGSCANYDWGPKHTEAYDDPSEYSSRGYTYRNCTDYVAWKESTIGVTVPRTLGNGGQWYYNAPANERSGTPLPGDAAVKPGNPGHVAYVESVNDDGTITVSEYNHSGMGMGGMRTGTPAALGFSQFVDFGVHPSGGTPESTGPPVYPVNLNFVRLNHYSGQSEVVGYTEDSGFKTLAVDAQTGYPAVATDHSVVARFTPDGNLSFIRLNHENNVEVATYSRSSGFKTLMEYDLTGYPTTSTDGSVVPLYQPDGDLSFVRLNHYSGNVEVVTYSRESGFKTMNEYDLTNYPAVSPDGSVVPVYLSSGDLGFIRLNHYSGQVELVAYSAASGYKTVSVDTLTGYPAGSPDGNVVPLIQPDGDLSFIRLNHSSGNVEEVTYSVGSNFQRMNDYQLTGYPDVPADGSVEPLYSLTKS